MSKLSSLNKLLPFVAIGTIADCQSVLDPTNRLLVRSGLQMISRGNLGLDGLTELLKQSGLQEKMSQGYSINSQDLGFTLSPILNSSGRLSHAKLSIEVLLARDDLKNQTALLIQTNQDRKLMVRDILEEIENEAESQFLKGKTVIWLEGNWSKGIVGLLASRLVNAYNLPTIIVSKEDDVIATASLRAPDGYHLPMGMQEIQDLFEKNGGHPGAAGFTAKIKNLPEIKQKLSDVLMFQGGKIDLKKDSYIPDWVYINTQNNHDFKSESQRELPKKLEKLVFQKNIIWVRDSEINTNFLQEILTLDPFGQDFPMPNLMFCIDLGRKNITQALNFRWVGNDQKHVKIIYNGISITQFNLKQDTKNELTPLIVGLKNLEKNHLWLQAKVSQNSWNGNTKMELIAENIWITD